MGSNGLLTLTGGSLNNVDVNNPSNYDVNNNLIINGGTVLNST